jgi:ribonuclease HIII
VVSAFYTDSETGKRLAALGVRDSKELTDEAIKKIASQIKKEFPENFSILSMKPEQYNQLYNQHGNNLNKLLIYSHSRAVEELLNKFDVKFVITDKFSFKNLDLVSDNRFRDIKFVQETKAEKYLGVAAASILARNEFVSWFDNLAAKGVPLPKGASNEVDKTAKALAKKYGKENLNRICKTHFKNFSKI